MCGGWQCYTSKPEPGSGQERERGTRTRVPMARLFASSCPRHVTNSVIGEPGLVFSFFSPTLFVRPLVQHPRRRRRGSSLSSDRHHHSTDENQLNIYVDARTHVASLKAVRLLLRNKPALRLRVHSSCAPRRLQAVQRSPTCIYSNLRTRHRADNHILPPFLLTRQALTSHTAHRPGPTAPRAHPAHAADRRRQPAPTAPAGHGGAASPDSHFALLGSSACHRRPLCGTPEQGVSDASLSCSTAACVRRSARKPCAHAKRRRRRALWRSSGALLSTAAFLTLSSAVVCEIQKPSDVHEKEKKQKARRSTSGPLDSHAPRPVK